MNDLISRQAAIDAVEKESQIDGAYGYMDTKSIVDLLSDLPSAQPEQRWTPCRERLPKEFEKVLVTDGSSIDVRDIVNTIDGFYKWEDLYGYLEGLDVWTAWMPLPGPYREEGE